LADAAAADPRDGRANRRRFTDEEKLTIVRESEFPRCLRRRGLSGHEIVTSMLFRWRIQFGFGKRPRATLAALKLVSAPSEAMVLNVFCSSRRHDGHGPGQLAACLLRQPAVIPTRCARIDSGEIAS
jgi:transposase-like protein